MPKDANYLIRLISSGDHSMSRDELVALIRKTGTDRYDMSRQQQFHDFYKSFDVDFFAERVTENELEAKLAQIQKDFPGKTKSDRNKQIHPDIAIVYDASRCEMIPGVYEGVENSDCYRFIGDPIDAIVEVRCLV